MKLKALVKALDKSTLVWREICAVSEYAVYPSFVSTNASQFKMEVFKNSAPGQGFSHSLSDPQIRF
jgi:hypothetical protein